MAFPIGPGQKVGGPNRSASFFIGRHLPEGFLTKKEEALPADLAGEVPRAGKRILSTEALQLLELERKTSRKEALQSERWQEGERFPLPVLVRLARSKRRFLMKRFRQAQSVKRFSF